MGQIQQSFEKKGGKHERSRVWGESSASGFEHAPLSFFSFRSKVRSEVVHTHAFSRPFPLQFSSGLKTPLPFQRCRSRPSFCPIRKSGKSGFPGRGQAFNKPDGSLYIRLPGESSWDSTGIFFGGEEEWKGMKGRNERYTAAPPSHSLGAREKHLYSFTGARALCHAEF